MPSITWKHIIKGSFNVQYEQDKWLHWEKPLSIFIWAHYYCFRTDLKIVNLSIKAWKGSLTIQSFSQRLQESFELHFLHRSQDVSCVQSFSLGFHGKVVCTETRLTRERKKKHISFNITESLTNHIQWFSLIMTLWWKGETPIYCPESNWILWISTFSLFQTFLIFFFFFKFLPGCCIQHKHAGSLGYGSPCFFWHVHPIWELLKTNGAEESAQSYIHTHFKSDNTNRLRKSIYLLNN